MFAKNKYLTVFFVFYSVISFAQFSVEGRVKADSLNNDMEGVFVYIPDLNISAETSLDGAFKFNSVPEGFHQIFFMLPGYKTSERQIHVTANLNLGIIKLKSGYIQICELVVFGNSNTSKAATSNVIDQISVTEMRQSGAMNLSDGIAKIPGVSQLSTGSGISKPVIRGLFGNRVQTVLYGLRFDNQQWQDEHGLGLSDVGVDRVEIIKGAASLLYGSEAMGGVINIIEEKNAAINKVNSDFSSTFYSNTYGVSTNAGVKASTSKFNWRLRAGMDSHADYTDGNNKRILNSRFGGYYAKAGIGFNTKRWINQTNYMFTQSNFGFLMDPVQLIDPPDDRLSRSFDRPHHTVNLNIIASQNTVLLNASKIKFNIGFQNNNRQEQEGGNKVSLNMILNSYIGNVVWNKQIKNTEINIGSQGYYQTNKNVGSRTIIPDANSIEGSLYTYIKQNFKKLVLEGGLRYDYRNIQTFATGLINTDPSTPGYYIKPFERTYGSFNGAAGISWFNKKNFNVKANFSSGYRAGNLAELSSNGLHEGTVRYEIGNTDLKIEQNLCGDFYATYFIDFFDVSISTYYNHFLNYIYLAPSNQQYIGFQIFNYTQNDANIKGFEAALNIHPCKNEIVNWMNNFAYTDGTLANHHALPFIPAPKFNSDLKFTLKVNKKVSEFYFKPGITYVLVQNRPGDFETSTVDYLLVNASTGIAVTAKRSNINISVAGNNILNNTYYDHLSRFKYFGIYNVGRNVSLNFKISFK